MSEYQKKQDLEDVRERSQREKNEKGSPEKKRPLNQVKNGYNSLKKRMNVAKETLDTFKQVKFLDFVYLIALVAAILKDILDLIQATGIGFFIVIVFTFIFSIFIFFMILLGGILDTDSKIKFRGAMKKYLTLLFGTMAEMLFGLNFLPIETMTVIAIYIIVLKERKRARESEKQAVDIGGTQESYA